MSREPYTHRFVDTGVWEGPSSIAVSGDGTRCVVGNSQINGAYVYVLKNNVWEDESYFSSDTYDDSPSFGNTVAISDDGTVVAIGSPMETPDDDIRPTIPDTDPEDDDDEYNPYGYEEGGVVYVYMRSGDAWKKHILIPVRSAPGNHMGSEVKLTPDGRTLVASASDSVTVFTYRDNVWTEIHSFQQSGTKEDVNTSIDVSDDGSCIVIGEPREGEPGRVSIYTIRDGIWHVEHWTVDTTDRTPFVSISGDASRLVIDDTVYVHTDGQWVREQRIESDDGRGFIRFSRSGNRLLYCLHGIGKCICGSYRSPAEPWIVHVFERRGSSWIHMTTLNPVPAPPGTSDDDDSESEMDRDDVNSWCLEACLSSDGSTVILGPMFVESRYVPVSDYTLD